MKKIVFIILSIFCFNIYPQVTEGWNPVITTGIPRSDNENEQLAVFANKDGIHVLTTVMEGTRSVKYYKLNSSGAFPPGFSAAGIELDDNGNFPTLVGDEDNIFAVFHKVSETGTHTIQVRKSDNGGNSWTTISPRTFLSHVSCNGVDASYNASKGLQVTWSEKVGSLYESYYNKFFNNVWEENQLVTNISPINNGGKPTITTSNISGTPRLHFSINTGNGLSMTDNFGQNFSRDYNYTSWQDPVAILPTGTMSAMDRMLVTDNDGYMHSFFYKYISPGNLDMYYRRKHIEEPSWGNEFLLSSTSSYTSNIHKVQILKTADGILHAFWTDPSFLPGPINYWGGFRQRKKFTDNTWSAPEEATEGGNQFSDLAVCNSSNDLYIVWGRNASNWTTLRYHQYDAAPLTPANFTGTTYNNHPKLTWTKLEPDIQYFEIYWQLVNYPKRPGAWNLLTTTSNTSFVDNGVQLGGAEWGDVNYKIRSKDYSDYYSPYTSIITFGYSGLNKTVASNDLNEYKLFSNYPNPFNPSTKISYSIKEEGLITLKVYDVLGKEVVTLVNENKAEGIYEVEFNASALPSGMYIYKLQAGSFTDVKKMLLTR